MGGQGSESETALRRTETSKEESFVTLSRSAADIQRIVVLEEVSFFLSIL